MKLLRLVPLAVLGLGLTQAASAQLKFVAVDVRVPIAPTPVVADGKTHLVYELRVTNLDRSEIALTGLQIFADSTPTLIASRSADQLKADSRFAGAPVGTDARLLPSGRQTLIYLWVTLPPGVATPARLRHRIAVEAIDSSKQARPDTVDRFYVPVRAVAPVVLSAPFPGGPWVAVNGPSNTSGHRRTAVPLYGEAQIGQRFATDWIKLGADGRAFHGDSLVNKNWYGYGVTVVAAADGIVTETKDSIIENVPFSPTMAVPITFETVGGNHVILDLGGGNYIFYAHLQPGSLKVKLGERVTRGQPIGWLGNSGNSTAPHLHFHLTNGNSPLGSEGRPWVWDRFELLDWPKGSFESTAWKAPGPPVARQREATLENMVVRFP